jgi:hypothetical protein
MTNLSGGGFECPHYPCFLELLYECKVKEAVNTTSFPDKQTKLLLAWIAIHEDELKANWQLLGNGDGYFRIEPLR